MKWTEEQIIQLKELYPNNKTDDIMDIMNLSKKSIECKACRLKLKRTNKHKSKMIGNRNKIVGTDITYELMRETALKYKTRGEFQRLDSSIYTTTRVAGLLDELCTHMVKGNYSIPQLILYYIISNIFNCEIIYNTKDIIPPYELDIFLPKYNIAFEYDGKYWHENNKKNIIKDDICNKNNIELLRIVENSRDYIKDIKQQLIENINLLNKYKNITIEFIYNINNEDIYKFVNENIDDLESIKVIISKYTNYQDFRKNEINTYNKLRRRGLLEELTKYLIKNRIEWTDELIKNEVSKYEYLGDFIKNSYSCYLFCKRNKKENLLNSLKRKYNYLDGTT
jgi:very-short-patch-repair endonuclease